MKSTIIFLFLAGCASSQVFEKQLEDQREQIIKLQKDIHKKELSLRKMFIRVNKNNQCSSAPEENLSTKPEIFYHTKTVCIGGGEEMEATCIELLVEE